MSGSGRKSQYRKSVTDKFLESTTIPQEGEEIVLVVGNRGDNLFEIQLSSGESELAKLPNKFNKLIWVKKNDYLIVEKNSEEESDLTSKVKFNITNVISKDNIKHLKTKNLWPETFNLNNKTSTTVEYSKDDLMPGYEDNSENDYDYNES